MDRGDEKQKVVRDVFQISEIYVCHDTQMGVNMDINLIFKIAAVGILVSVLNQILKQSGRDEQAFLTTLAGLILVLFWIVPYISDLFKTIQNLFTLYERESGMLQIALVGISVVLLAIIFKNYKSEYSVYISLAGCILIFYLGVSRLELIISTIKKIQSYINLNDSYLGILIKIIGITYICEFTSDLCKDFGHTAVANQIELVGKLTILATGMPILLALLDTINKFLTS